VLCGSRVASSPSSAAQPHAGNGVRMQREELSDGGSLESVKQLNCHRLEVRSNVSLLYAYEAQLCCTPARNVSRGNAHQIVSAITDVHAHDEMTDGAAWWLHHHSP
jgi:hypothetical protein